MIYLSIFLVTLAILLFALGHPAFEDLFNQQIAQGNRAAKVILKISKSRIVQFMLVCVIGFVIYDQFGKSQTVEEQIQQVTVVPHIYDYSLDQCKTCDNDGCIDSSLFSRITVDRKHKRYSLFSLGSNGRELKHRAIKSETCEFSNSEDDPFRFVCHSTFQNERSVGTLSIRLENDRLTIEKEYPINGKSEYFHSSTTCPIKPPWM